MEETILNIIRTLETIRVSGKDDMEKMLGCIYALNELKTKARDIALGEEKR